MAKYGGGFGTLGNFDPVTRSYSGQPSGNFFGRFNTATPYRPPAIPLTPEQIGIRNAPTSLPAVNKAKLYGGSGNIPTPRIEASRGIPRVKRAGVKQRNLSKLKNVKRRPMSKQDMSSLALRSGGNNG